MNSRPLFRSDSAYESAMSLYDEALELLTHPYDCTTVPTRYGDTHVISCGDEDAPVVLLWHGMNVNSTMWVGLMNCLAPLYRVYAIDTIGNQGRSAATRPDKHSLAHSEWALDVMDALHVQQAHCVGFSQGGWLIFRLAELAGNRILSAVLLSCAGIAPINYSLLLRMAPALFFPIGEQRAYALIRLTSAPRHKPSPYEVRVFMNMQDYHVEGVVPLLQPEQIRSLTAPVKLIMGSYDRTFRAARVTRRLQKFLPKAEVTILGGLSHGLEENRPLVYDHIIQFIERHTKQTP